MKFATIDLGTNSVRFDIHQVRPRGKPKRLHREKLMVRLGQGVFTDGRLDPEAVMRTLDAFRSFKITCQELKVQRIVAFATSALREAQDAPRLLSLIKTRTGIEIKIISGQEEAKLIAQGILKNEKKLKGLFGIVDIGGGSTEIIVCRNKKVQKTVSLELGTARLQQVFLKRSPPRAKANDGMSAVEALRDHIQNMVIPLFEIEKWPDLPIFWGASGTARALAKLIHRSPAEKNLSFTRAELSQLVKKMSTMTTSQLLNLQGMESKRVDMILAGAILQEELMLAFGTKKLFCTDFSLRDGILDSEVNAIRSLKDKSHVSLQMNEVWRVAKKLNIHEGHVRCVLNIADRLFKDLKRIHKLEDVWRDYLHAAVILHDSGKAINSAQHDRHSYYVVRNADLPLLDKWEIEFIAQLCLNHKNRKLDEVPFQKNKTQFIIFKKLLALLRIADAMCQDSRNPVHISRTRILKDRVILRIQGKSSIELTRLRVEQKKAVFVESFKRSIVLEN